jgi:hypothetical protein
MNKVHRRCGTIARIIAHDASANNEDESEVGDAGSG